MKAKQELEKIKKETNDYVKSITPSPTKKVKGFGGKEKEVPKTEDELENDRKILAAQAVLQREEAVAQIEEKQKAKDKEQAAVQRATEAKAKEVRAREANLERESKSLFAIVAIKARQAVNKLLQKWGFKTTKTYDVDSQTRVAIAVRNQNKHNERSRQNENNRDY